MSDVCKRVCLYVSVFTADVFICAFSVCLFAHMFACMCLYVLKHSYVFNGLCSDVFIRALMFAYVSLDVFMDLFMFSCQITCRRNALKQGNARRPWYRRLRQVPGRPRAREVSCSANRGPACSASLLLAGWGLRVPPRRSMAGVSSRRVNSFGMMKFLMSVAHHLKSTFLFRISIIRPSANQSVLWYLTASKAVRKLWIKILLKLVITAE